MVGAALCTDLAVAANFTSLFFFMAEALWLASLWIAVGRKSDATEGEAGLSVWRPAAALILAGGLFLPAAAMLFAE